MTKKITDSTPAIDGFWMPSELQEQERTYMIWPESTACFRNGAKPAQQKYAEVAKLIAKHQPVTMFVSDKNFDVAVFMLDHPNIQVIEMSNNDAWARDSGPNFIINGIDKTRLVDWTFNAYGGLNGGLYFPWNKDDKIPRKIAHLLDIDYYRAEGFVIEGGAISSDGKGTLFTTEQCMLNPNRNPHLNKNEIEQMLKDYLGVKKVMLIPYGIVPDETGGHVDDVVHLVEPGHITLHWTDDINDPNYERMVMNLKYLESETDAKGRKFKITKIHQPDPMFYTKEEAEGVDATTSMERSEGWRLAPSYICYYLCNNAVIAPLFGDKKWDNNFLKIIKELYPNRKIEAFNSRELIIGGGECWMHHFNSI